MNQKKPQLLLIAGYFPPVKISTGSIRPWNLTKQLIKLGWDVTVVTPKISIWDQRHVDNSSGYVEEIEDINLNMIYTDHSYQFLAPERYNCEKSRLAWFLGGCCRVIARKIGLQNWYGWLPSALQSCRSLQQSDVDVILATGAPFIGFEIAYHLGKRLNRPYVMDYRDLWTNNPWKPNKKRWVIEQERKLLNNCAAITLVSPVSAIALNRKFGFLEKSYVITNGYDPDHINRIFSRQYDHFSIVFAGSLIPPKLTLAPLLAALKYIKDLTLPSPTWRFHYFGPNTDWVHHEISNWCLEDVTVIHSNLPREEVLTYVKGSNLAVVISSNSENATLEELGVIPAKIFEIIGLGVPILSIVPHGSAVETIVVDVGNGGSFASHETFEIAHFVIDCMNGKTNDQQNRDKYSWSNLAKSFDNLLRQIINPLQR